MTSSSLEHPSNAYQLLFTDTNEAGLPSGTSHVLWLLRIRLQLCPLPSPRHRRWWGLKTNTRQSHADFRTCLLRML